MKDWIDLRSDTVTKPTDKMREAMASAIVGDDVYDDDPTVIELETYAAEIIGKEAALFVPTGTFGNQLALFTHCNRGDEVILGADCHIVAHEAGAAAVIAGVQLRTLETNLGQMALDSIKRSIRVGVDIHWPTTGLICLENAYSNGTALSPSYMASVKQIADRHQVKIHLDGARLFNAAHSLGIDAKELTKHSDTVMFCLSKGLCAPIGSILAGSKEFIQKARKNRKLLGGGMRQVGIVAAAGLIALQEVRLQLENDHDNAKILASRLATLPGVVVQEDWNDINMVFCTIISDIPPSLIVDKLYEKGFKVNGPSEGYWRFVTHLGVSDTNIYDFAEVLSGILTSVALSASNQQDSPIDLAMSLAQSNLETAINRLNVLPINDQASMATSAAEPEQKEMMTMQGTQAASQTSQFQPIPTTATMYETQANTSSYHLTEADKPATRTLRYVRGNRKIHS